MRQRLSRMLATGAVLATMAVAAPTTASAASCTYWKSGPNQWSAVCPDSMPGTQFRAGVGCALWSGGYVIYNRYGQWTRQGTGYASKAACDAGHYVVQHSIGFR